MNKDFVANYLIANGKYFPKKKLQKIGLLLENANAPLYNLNLRYFNPLTTTIIFWVFYPIQLFDRLILRDWVFGLLKLIIPILILYLANKYKLGLSLGVLTLEGKILGVLFLLWGVWTIIDGFTIYGRTKNANFRALLRALKLKDANTYSNLYKPARKTDNTQELSSEIKEWRIKNPKAPLNDFYKMKSKRNSCQ